MPLMGTTGTGIGRAGHDFWKKKTRDTRARIPEYTRYPCPRRARARICPARPCPAREQYPNCRTFFCAKSYKLSSSLKPQKLQSC